MVTAINNVPRTADSRVFQKDIMHDLNNVNDAQPLLSKAYIDSWPYYVYRDFRLVAALLQCIH